MARYNEILVGRFNRGIQKALSIKGEAPSPQIASEIMPELSIPFGKEYDFIFSWNHYAVDIEIGAVAAQNGTGMLRNPATSNVIAVVYKVVPRVTSAILFQSNPSADLATPVTTIIMDNRQGVSGGKLSALNASSTTLAGQPVGANVIYKSAAPSAGASLDMITMAEQQIILPPGAGLIIQDATVNEAAVFCYWWKERFLEDSERTG